MKKIDGNFLINGWMKHHNTTIKEVFENHPEYKEDNRQFFLDYGVTQEQHDEWVIWAKEEIRKVTKLSKKFIDRQWGLIYLDLSPHVKDYKNEITGQHCEFVTTPDGDSINKALHNEYLNSI